MNRPYLTALALWAIRVYQRMISPYKGFRCAYRGYTGHASCSALGYRAIRRFGVTDGIAVLQARLHKCGVAHRRYRPAPGRAMASQGGFLDCDDMTCAMDLCDCAFDWPSSDKKKEKKDAKVVLPPKKAGPKVNLDKK